MKNCGTIDALPSVKQRGFFGIGVAGSKNPLNIGTLWRTAFVFDAAFIFTVMERYPKQASDTLKTWRHVPLFHYETVNDFYTALPYDCQVVGIEIDESACELPRFNHPERAVYVLGAEDRGLPREVAQICHSMTMIPGNFCLNVAVAGGVVLYDRICKGWAQGKL